MSVPDLNGMPYEEVTDHYNDLIKYLVDMNQN